MVKWMDKKIMIVGLGFIFLSATAWGGPPSTVDTKDLYWQLRGYDKSLESFHQLWSQILQPREYSKDSKIRYYQQLDMYPKHQIKFADALSTMATPKSLSSTSEQLYQRQTNEYPKTKEEFRILRKKYK